MVVNFRSCGFSRGVSKLVRIPMLIIKKKIRDPIKITPIKIETFLGFLKKYKKIILK